MTATFVRLALGGALLAGSALAALAENPMVGGAAMYPEKMIFDVAGFPAIRGRDLVKNLVEQAAPYDPQYLLGVRAQELTYDDGKLAIAATGNADLPLKHGSNAVLTCDVWEHAYYIDYRNARPNYVDAFLDNLINWTLLEQALKTRILTVLPWDGI